MTETPHTPHVELRIEEVTPERALDLIVANTNNRGVRDTTVASYARDMAEGRWLHAAGEPVHVDPTTGEIGNGQHRILAVIESEVTVKLPFLYAPLEYRLVADQGIKRTFGDVLKVNHQAVDQNKLAAAVRLLWEYRKSGLIGYSQNQTIEIDGVTMKVGKPSVAELEAVYMAEPGVREHVNVCSRLREHGVNMFCSVAIVLDYLLHQVDYDDADAFMERAVHGDQLDPGSPILALRRVLGGPSRPNRARTQAAFTIKTWNAWRNGDEIKNLVWRAGGASPEPFPQIDGMAKTRQPRRRKRA